MGTEELFQYPKGFGTEDRDQPFSSSSEGRAKGKGLKLQHEGLRLERGVRPPNRQVREAMLSFPPGNEEARLALVWCGFDLDWGQQEEWVTSSILLWCLRRCPEVWPNGFSSLLAFAGWGLGMLKPSPQLLG